MLFEVGSEEDWQNGGEVYTKLHVSKEEWLSDGNMNLVVVHKGLQ